MSDCARLEDCPKCGEVAKRIFTPPAGFTGTKAFEAHYNPAFGKVVTSQKQLDYEAKKRDMVCVGNDFGSGDKMQKYYDDKRAYDREKAWENVKIEHWWNLKSSWACSGTTRPADF